jgi:hypothetical protein
MQTHHPITKYRHREVRPEEKEAWLKYPMRVFCSLRLLVKSLWVMLVAFEAAQPGIKLCAAPPSSAKTRTRIAGIGLSQGQYIQRLPISSNLFIYAICIWIDK